MAPSPHRDEMRAHAEHRWPAGIAIIVALAIYALLPSTFATGLRIVVVAICLLMFLPLITLNPRHLVRQTRWSRLLSMGSSVVLLAANQVALVQLIVQLVGAAKTDGPSLLLAAVQVWATNIIVFALIFWELDRGGPVARRRDARGELPVADFRFPQDEDHDTIDEVRRGSSDAADWMPGYVDYLYFSGSNSMAFSPTDVMPLSHRAKLLMLVEAVTGFVILALVIARAVSLLGQ